MGSMKIIALSNKYQLIFDEYDYWGIYLLFSTNFKK